MPVMEGRGFVICEKRKDRSRESVQEWSTAMPNSVSVAKVSDFDDQPAKCVEVAGKKVALFKLGDEFFAIDDTCTHVGGPLSEGTIDGDEIECPLHGAHFNIRTGQVTGGPASDDVSKYNVRLSGDEIEIEVVE